ncbi:MAG: hypothetical protein ACFFA6_16310 [Promethearchaeota archaeon]
MKTIYTTVRLGKWKKLRITSWNDLLKEVFNQRKYREDRFRTIIS